MVWSVSGKSDEFCRRIIEAGLHAAILENLQWNTISASTVDDPQSHAKRTAVGLQISILHNVARRIIESARSALRKHQAVSVVQKFRDVKNYPVIMFFFWFVTHNNKFNKVKKSRALNGTPSRIFGVSLAV